MSRFQKPFETVSQRHEDALRHSREALTAAVRHKRICEGQRPRLTSRIAVRFERLWKERLGLRPRPRFRRRLPVLPRQHHDRRLRRLRRTGLQGHGKQIRRLRHLATHSWTARWLRVKIALLRLWSFLHLRPAWAAALFLVTALLALRWLMPSMFKDLLAFLAVEMLGR